MELFLGLGCIVTSLALGVWLLRLLVRAFQPAKPASRVPARAHQRAARRAGPESHVSIRVTVDGFTVRSSDSPRPADEARWVPVAEAVMIGPYTITGGMLYVGRHLAPVAGWRSVEPALLNPELPIDDDQCDWAGAQMGYWPSYSDIQPGCRAAYLRWLADGRKHPTVDIGYVFLFFYGLERRFIVDDKRVPLPEKQAIVAEVERLLSLYGQHTSFAGYARDFVNIARLQTAGTRVSEGPPPAIRQFGDLSLPLRIGLGEFSNLGRPIPTAWALAWLRAHPTTRLRTPAERCATEFETLFERRYRAQFGDGMVVKPNRTRVQGSYKAASASFGGEVPIPVADLPDITALTAPLRKLQDIAENGMEDLEPYSRLLGRKPEARDSVAAIALLPTELAAEHESSDARRLAGAVEAALSGGDAATVPGGELVKLWDKEPREKLPKAEAVLLAQFLQKRGFGLEPDVRFGGTPLSTDVQAVIFRLPHDSPSAPSAHYDAASILLHLAAAVAQADGTVDAAEEDHLIAHLQEALHLEKPERLRLAARLRWVLANPVGLGGLKKRLAQLDDARRQTVSQFLVSVAVADGRVETAEVKALTKIYSLLGLDGARVYTDLHELGLADDEAEPVTVRPASPGAPGYKIPASRASGGSVLTLDVNRVRAKMAETAAVGALLRDVFVEEEPPPPTAAPAVAAITGLDEAHSAFLRGLATRPSWPRAELEARAAELRLLLDGALEVINDRAFDTCGEAACEGEDPVETNVEVLKELAT